MVPSHEPIHHMFSSKRWHLDRIHLLVVSVWPNSMYPFTLLSLIFGCGLKLFWSFHKMHFAKFMRWAYIALHSLFKNWQKGLTVQVGIAKLFSNDVAVFSAWPTSHNTKIYQTHCYSTLRTPFQIKWKFFFQLCHFLRCAWHSVFKMYVKPFLLACHLECQVLTWIVTYISQYIYVLPWAPLSI